MPMNTSEPILRNTIDKFIFIILSGSLMSFFILWFITNILQTNNPTICLIPVPLSFISAIFLSRYYSLYHEKTTHFTVVCYALLFLLIIVSSLFYLEPIIRYPYSAIGIPNKDLHDGISVFINKYGYPPSDVGSLTRNEQFIPNTNKGLFLGYPNALHVAAGYSMRLGVSAFHATWIVVLSSLILSSLSIFLILRALWDDAMLAALFGGLFLISSARIPYGIATSIPMMFAYSLVLPTFTICLVALQQGKNVLSLIIPCIAIAVLTASYFGMFMIIFGMLALYCGILILKKLYVEAKKIGFLFVLALPLLALVLVFQKTIYWENILATAKDFDPYELSQYLFPLDKAFYMVIYFVSFFIFSHYVFKKNSKLSHPLAITLIIMNGLLLLLIPFDGLFHAVRDVYSTDALIKSNPLGFFGGLNHQRASRLALMQPYFFILIIPALFTLIRSKIVRYISVVAAILVFCISPFDISIYNMLQFKFQGNSGFFNNKDVNKPYTLLSNYRFIIPEGLWSQNIVDGLNFLQHAPNVSRIMLWDERSWSETSIVGWGSLYLQTKIEPLYNVLKLDKRDFNFQQVSILQGREVYLMIINQSPKMSNTLYPFEEVFENSQVAIYRIE